MSGFPTAFLAHCSRQRNLSNSLFPCAPSNSDVVETSVKGIKRFSKQKCNVCEKNEDLKNIYIYNIRYLIIVYIIIFDFS